MHTELKLPETHRDKNKDNINSAYKPADINLENANKTSNLEVISADSTVVKNSICDKVVSRSVKDNQNINLLSTKPNCDIIELVVSDDKGISHKFKFNINQRLSKYLFIICNIKIIKVNLNN